MLRSPPSLRWRSSSILPSSSASGFSNSRKWRMRRDNYHGRPRRANPGHALDGLFLPRQRMRLGDQAFQPLALHMGIDLRRRDVGVAEHLLNAAQIRAAVDQVAGEGVAQHMRRQFRRIEPGGERQLLEQLPATPPRQMAGGAARRKEPARSGPVFQKTVALIEIVFERASRRLAERHEAFFRTLAAHDQKARIALCRGERQRDELRHAQPRAVEQLDQAEEARAFGTLFLFRRFDQARCFILLWNFGQRTLRPWSVERRAAVLAASCAPAMPAMYLRRSSSDASASATPRRFRKAAAWARSLR